MIVARVSPDDAEPEEDDAMAARSRPTGRHRRPSRTVRLSRAERARARHPKRLDRRSRRAVLVGALVLGCAGTSAGLPVVGAAAATTNPPMTGNAHRNLLSGAEATFDGGIASWGANGGTASATSSPVRSGTGALAVQRDGSATGSVLARSATDSTGWLTAVPGNRYVGTAAVRGPGRYAYARVTFLDSTGKSIATAPGQNALEQSNGWVQLSSAVGIAPPSAAYVELDVSIMSVPVGERHFLDDASLVTAPGGSPDIAGPLHTSGAQILDANGNVVMLRGFNRSGLERDSTLAPTSEELDWAKAWGANAIRLNLGEQFWLSTSCKYDSAYVGRVDTAVQQITGRGMLALLDLHYVTTTPCGTAGNKPMADAANAPTFWRQVATRYKNNSRVAFDLYNEPHSINDSVWLNGGTAAANAKGTLSYRVSGMQQLYDVVRGTGATNLVVISGNYYSSEPPSTPVSGTNIVYAGHIYTCPNNLPPDCSTPNPLDPTPRLARWLSLAATTPFMATEFGWRDANEGRFNEAVVAYAEAHGWGWLQFSWQDGTYGPFNPFSSAGRGVAYEPAPSGAAALAGLPGSTGSDGMLADLVDTRVAPSSSPSSPTPTPSPSPSPIIKLPLL